MPVPRVQHLRLALSATAVLALAGCGRCSGDNTDAPTPDATARPAPDEPSLGDAPAPPPLFDILANLDSCEIRHRGISIDVGTRAASARRGFDVGPFEDVTDVEREGATFGRVLERRLDYDFWLDRPVENVQVSLRVHGVAGKGMVVNLDDRRLGFAKLTRGETRIVTFPPVPSALGAGRHTLHLRFSGRPRDTIDAYAEVDGSA